MVASFDAAAEKQRPKVFSKLKPAPTRIHAQGAARCESICSY